MAKKDTKARDFTDDEHHGVGGSYRVGDDGVRVRVERTEAAKPQSAPQPKPEPKE